MMAESRNSRMSRGGHITARQWQGKHISEATIEDAVFSMLPLCFHSNKSTHNKKETVGSNDF
jgi:hypothetical protein